MTTLPIRIAIRVDFSDGSQHEYEVRGPDAVDAPAGMVLWPAAVVSTAMREQITLEQAATQALAAAEGKLRAVREWAGRYETKFADARARDDMMEAGYLGAVRDVMSILDGLPAMADALMNYMVGVPSWSDHFLTLADGRTLTIPEGKEAWEVYEPYLLACLSEGMCPWCTTSLNERRECYDARHRPCRWHTCPEGFGQVFLDVPRRREPALCGECGEAM